MPTRVAHAFATGLSGYRRITIPLVGLLALIVAPRTFSQNYLGGLPFPTAHSTLSRAEVALQKLEDYWEVRAYVQWDSRSEQEVGLAIPLPSSVDPREVTTVINGRIAGPAQPYPAGESSGDYPLQMGVYRVMVPAVRDRTVEISYRVPQQPGTKDRYFFDRGWMEAPDRPVTVELDLPGGVAWVFSTENTSGPVPWVAGDGQTRISAEDPAYGSSTIAYSTGRAEIRLATTLNDLPKAVDIEQFDPVTGVQPLSAIRERVSNKLPLRDFSEKDLRLARNTLFAIHGYRFADRGLHDYFSQYVWYIPDPAIPNDVSILDEDERNLLTEIKRAEVAPSTQSDDPEEFLRSFQEAFRLQNTEALWYHFHPGFLERTFGGATEIQSMMPVITRSAPSDMPIHFVWMDGVSRLSKSTRSVVSARLERGPGTDRSYVTFVLVPMGQHDDPMFRLIGPHEWITNYEHRIEYLRDVNHIKVRIQSHEDPYARRAAAWIVGPDGEWICLDGEGCDPEVWKSKHCSDLVVGGSHQMEYDLSRFTKTPYRGPFRVAVSSYVGHWTAEIVTD